MRKNQKEINAKIRQTHLEKNKGKEFVCKQCGSYYRSRDGGTKRYCKDHRRPRSGDIPFHALKKRKSLKSRLITDRGHQCEECGLTSWRDRPTPLELDHIDGNKYNNDISNLRLLCPNCHAQTDTYAGKNAGRYVGTFDSEFPVPLR